MRGFATGVGSKADIGAPTLTQPNCMSTRLERRIGRNADHLLAEVAALEQVTRIAARRRSMESSLKGETS